MESHGTGIEYFLSHLPIMHVFLTQLRFRGGAYPCSHLMVMFGGMQYVPGWRLYSG